MARRYRLVRKAGSRRTYLEHRLVMEATLGRRLRSIEGGHNVCPGDWLITGVEGEHYPCKPSIFAATYDPA